jgi:hypothetical protein
VSNPSGGTVKDMEMKKTGWCFGAEYCGGPWTLKPVVLKDTFVRGVIIGVWFIGWILEERG